VHAGIHTRTRVNVKYVDAATIDSHGAGALQGVDAIIVPGGFGERGIEGMIATVRHARENGIPYLGICLGLHVAVIEYARNVLGLAHAHSTEFERNTPDPVIALVTEWVNARGDVELRSEKSDLGGTMRLGAQECVLATDSLARRCYGKDVIVERHRHRYEVNDNYVEALQGKGLRFTGRSIDGQLMVVIEIHCHPCFLACQFHPDFSSTLRDGHPLFTAFVHAAIAQSNSK